MWSSPGLKDLLTSLLLWGWTSRTRSKAAHDVHRPPASPPSYMPAPILPAEAGSLMYTALTLGKGGSSTAYSGQVPLTEKGVLEAHGYVCLPPSFPVSRVLYEPKNLELPAPITLHESLPKLCPPKSRWTHSTHPWASRYLCCGRIRKQLFELSMCLQKSFFTVREGKIEWEQNAMGP